MQYRLQVAGYAEPFQAPRLFGINVGARLPLPQWEVSKTTRKIAVEYDATNPENNRLAGSGKSKVDLILMASGLTMFVAVYMAHLRHRRKTSVWL
ncbi:hypothetical protein WH50_24655 [Pokkaliibacter plantistimulans]|uniref:Uncharacterized protein n=1 Tax=Pokkaliibacter plantistimulans TaxID=1635171 RepID=A0ABX5LT90_9GAMM|nr:hypothetical protein WH50_24655 [Pokkaliibacter plantistimulans]